MIPFFQDSPIAWGQNLCNGLKLLDDIRNKVDNELKLRQTLNDLERYFNIEICMRIEKKDLREPLFVQSFPILLNAINKALDQSPNNKKLSQLECDLSDYILSCGFYSQLSIKGCDEALLKINHIFHCLKKNKGTISLDVVVKCLRELHGVRLAISYALFEKISEEFEEIDDYLKELEFKLWEEIFKDFQSYVSQFPTDDGQNSETMFLLEHHVHPGTRRWIVDLVVKWSRTSKKLMLISGKEGSGKTAICSVLYNLIPYSILAIHKVERINNSSISELIVSIFNQLRLASLKFRTNTKDLKSCGNWCEDFEILLKQPLELTFGFDRQPKNIVVIDSPENALKFEIKEFIAKFVCELPPCIGLILTVDTRYGRQFSNSCDHGSEIVILHERYYLSKHVNDLEIYVSGVVGALLAGEHDRDIPTHACSDERIVQKCVDELLGMSGGRFDYVKEMMTVLVKEMERTGEFRSSVKKASSPVGRCKDLHNRLIDFTSSFRFYRDHNRNDPANFNQPIQLVQKSRVALVKRLFNDDDNNV
ncbi:DgyrCDS12906 [Dimorphilus gyrociliatus]|uniref:DgyrCDS12906 n=1 Tax=Dimorphilus gyrociliatus TaxID=2664684 RepID=A0A7I8W931_9ANNE|nr:DgyrCDS12906 [Dimorphilus gyrociliatus]